jgi:hypothetical protein
MNSKNLFAVHIDRHATIDPKAIMKPYTVIAKSIPQPPIPQPDKIEKRIQIELTAEEVVALRLLFDHTGGHPDSTARGFISSIEAKLPPGSHVEADYGRIPKTYVTGSAYFTDHSRGNRFNEAVARINRL